MGDWLVRIIKCFLGIGTRMASKAETRTRRSTKDPFLVRGRYLLVEYYFFFLYFFTGWCFGKSFGAWKEQVTFPVSIQVHVLFNRKNTEVCVCVFCRGRHRYRCETVFVWYYKIQMTRCLRGPGNPKRRRNARCGSGSGSGHGEAHNWPHSKLAFLNLGWPLAPNPDSNLGTHDRHVSSAGFMDHQRSTHTCECLQDFGARSKVGSESGSYTWRSIVKAMGAWGPQALQNTAACIAVLLTSSTIKGKSDKKEKK